MHLNDSVPPPCRWRERAGYPCIRIPSILLAGDNRTLNAFAECRRVTGDGCSPLHFHSMPGGSRDICQKQSTDGGKTVLPNHRTAPTTNSLLNIRTH